MTLTSTSSRLPNESKYNLCLNYKSSMNQQTRPVLRSVDVRGITHEMRTPLTNINLSLAGLTEGTIDPELVRYFDIIERSAKKLNDLICLLLRNQEVAVAEEIEIIDLNDLISEVVTGCADRFALKEISCTQSLCSDRLPIMGNRSDLATAFHNLVINAIEAMTSGIGHLMITSGHSSRGVCISVADNGAGICEANVKKLFVGKFTTKASGMGVGLSVTKRIVDNHNGTIEVTSVVGQGSTFTVVFPQIG